MQDETTYSLTRSNRKSIALYVRDSGLEVRAPFRMSKAEIDRFVEQKKDWVDGKITELAERQKQKKEFTIYYGSRVLYRGQKWFVGGVAGKKVYFDRAFCIPCYLTPQQCKRACVQIYRLLAKRDLSEKVLSFGKQMGVNPSGIKINGAKTRWGSCSAKKALNFSWRLMMAEDDVIDYVVVHELAHIKEMNHSAKFWAIVEGILPDYKERKKKLKELQKRLSTEDWG